MLILTRCPGERLVIGDEITISIEQINGLQVRLGIAAPKQIPVHRLEVFEHIQAGKNSRCCAAQVAGFNHSGSPPRPLEEIKSVDSL